MRNARLILPALALVVAAAVLIGAVAAHSSDDSRKAVVKTARSDGKTILVNRSGHTLYRLSVERRGHFICTSAFCLSLWKPLLIARGTTPTGVRSLGTVRRPDGRVQVAYRGGPLYTFVQDRKPGDTAGDGFKDVGVWHPVVLAGADRPMAPKPAYGGGY